MMSKRTTFSILVAALMLISVDAFAVTHVVDSTASDALAPGATDCTTAAGECTLQAAIEISANGDTIDATGVTGTTAVGGTSIDDTITLVADGLQVNVAGLLVTADDVAITGVHFIGTISVQGARAAVDSNTIDGTLILSRSEDSVVTNNVIYGPAVGIQCASCNGTMFDSNVIGLDETGARVSGSTGYGLLVSNASGVVVSNNHIAGFQFGLYMNRAAGALVTKSVFGDTPGDTGNGASRYGVYAVSSDGTLDANHTNGNAMGGLYLQGATDLDVSGHVSHDNGGAGVEAAYGATMTVLGSSLENNSQGIVSDSPGSVFHFNRITQNAGLGIDLGAGGVSGDFTPFPTLGTATGGAAISVDGNYAGEANTNYTLEFFDSATCDDSGNGEGVASIGTIDITTDGLGDAVFSANFSVGVAADRVVTATATGPNGTSEFSGCTTVLPGADPTVEVEFYKLNRWTFNPKSWKPLLGIFLGSDTQDVDDIDLTTVYLGAASVKIAFKFDANRDGYTDMIVAFKARDTDAVCDDTTLDLTGETVSGAEFTETLGIRTVGCNCPHGKGWRK